MSFDVFTTSRFEKSAKGLAKRHKSIKTDIGQLILSLENNPIQGDELTPGIRKIRMAIKSKGRGKSGGARVITYNVLINESHGRVYLIDIYDKADFSTVDTAMLKSAIEDMRLL